MDAPTNDGLRRDSVPTSGHAIDGVTIPWDGSDADLLRLVADRLTEHPELRLLSVQNHDFGSGRNPAEWEILIEDTSSICSCVACSASHIGSQIGRAT